jgi:hypothetical protein
MKIQVISMARSASRYLSSLLFNNLDGYIAFYSEPFGISFMQEYNKKYVNKIIKTCKKHSCVLLKSHINQYMRIKNDEQLDYFLNDESWYKILLLRKDLFKVTLSHTIADILDNFNEKEYNKTMLHVPITQFKEMLNNKIEHVELFAKFKSKYSYHKLIYFENLTFNEAVDLSTFSFIKTCNPIKIHTKTPTNLITILNKDELEQIFFDTVKNYSHPLVINKNGMFELL